MYVRWNVLQLTIQINMNVLFVTLLALIITLPVLLNNKLILLLLFVSGCTVSVGVFIIFFEAHELELDLFCAINFTCNKIISKIQNQCSWEIVKSRRKKKLLDQLDKPVFYQVIFNPISTIRGPFVITIVNGIILKGIVRSIQC